MQFLQITAMDLNNLINKIGIKQKEENKALNEYIENSNKNKEKLESLLSRFSEIITDNNANELFEEEMINEYYNYLSKNIDDFNADSINIMNYQSICKIIGNDYSTNAKFGLFLSALINKNIKNGEEIQLNLPIPIHYLFYKLENAKAHVNIAGDYLGDRAKNSRIYAEEAMNCAGRDIEGCELHVKKAQNYLGNYAKNSEIYAGEAKDNAGLEMQGCELHINIAGDYLGDRAKNSRIYAEEARDYAGKDIEGCELHVKKVRDQFGTNAKNSEIYADEAGTQIQSLKILDLFPTGSGMKNSKLFIYKLGDSLDYECLTGNNKIYLGWKSYRKNTLGYMLNGVRIWRKR